MNCTKCELTKDDIVNVWRQQHFSCFGKNGKWGTCVDCPRTEVFVFPEWCENTDRHDHNMTLEQLVDAYKRRLT